MKCPKCGSEMREEPTIGFYVADGKAELWDAGNQLMCSKCGHSEKVKE